MAWVLSRADREGSDVFFIGTDKYGRVRWSVFWSEAARFGTARAAYECAGTHPDLRNSDDWRVVAITERCGRTR
jgi:hypothetical protein